MQTYLFSMHPKWCEKIFNGEKTIEVRKTAPKEIIDKCRITRPPQSYMWVQDPEEV